MKNSPHLPYFSDFRLGLYIFSAKEDCLIIELAICISKVNYLKVVIQSVDSWAAGALKYFNMRRSAPGLLGVLLCLNIEVQDLSYAKLKGVCRPTVYRLPGTHHTPIHDTVMHHVVLSQF